MAEQEFNANSIENVIAQSAFAQSRAASGINLLTEVIVSTPYSGIAEYQGTRAALEAEGVIPAGTTWPEGFSEFHWDDDKFSYWIRRKRPDGIRGPRKQFLNLDWWMFRCTPLNGKHLDVSAVESKAKELADAIYRHSAKGKAECRKKWDNVFEAERDDKFQAFKALIPCLIRPKRGRKPTLIGEKTSQD